MGTVKPYWRRYDIRNYYCHWCEIPGAERIGLRLWRNGPQKNVEKATLICANCLTFNDEDARWKEYVSRERLIELGRRSIRHDTYSHNTGREVMNWFVAALPPDIFNDYASVSTASEEMWNWWESLALFYDDDVHVQRRIDNGWY